VSVPFRVAEVPEHASVKLAVVVDLEVELVPGLGGLGLKGCWTFLSLMVESIT